MALTRPVTLRPNPLRPGTYLSGRISQAFLGSYSGERPGYVRTDLPIDRGNKSRFYRSTYRTDVHLALDFACPIGTPVYAVHDGVIVAQGKYSYTGEYYTILRVRRGLRYQVVALYTHLEPGTFRFHVGDKVARGQIIAKTGNSGWSTGPHLHFEIRRGYRWETPSFVNTYRWLRFDPAAFISGGKTLSDIS